MKVEFALAQAIGERENQEDSCAVVADGSVTDSAETPFAAGSARSAFFGVMCDGMGGHASGEVAARLAVSAVVESVLAAPAEAGAVAHLLRDGCARANEDIAATAKAHPQTDGMGTTLVAIGLENGALHWISVGDSHLLLLRKGQLTKLNEDHSMRPAIDRMVAEGIISQDEASSHPDRNALRSVLMGEPVSLIDTGFGGWPLQAGDTIILASDGIDVLDVGEIKRAFEGRRPKTMEATARHLVERACAAGGARQDNTSVIVVRVQ